MRRGVLRLYTVGGAPFSLATVIILVQAATGILILAVFQTYLPDELGAGLAYPGYAITAFSVVKLVVHTPAGLAADRLGRRRALSFGVAAAIPALLLMLLVPNAAAFVAFAGLYGLSSAVVWPALYALLADLHAEGERGHALAFLNAGYLVGFGLGAMLGALLTDYASAQIAFGVCVVLNLAATVIAWRLPEGGSTAVNRTRIRQSIWRMLPVFANRGVALLSGVVLLAGVATSMLAPVLRAYAIDFLGVDFSLFIVYMFVPASIAALSFVPAGLLADRFGRLRPLTAGLLLCGVALAAMGVATGPLFAAVAASFALVGYAMIQPSWAAALLDEVPEEMRATFMGAVTGLLGFASAIGPSLGGTIAQHFGPEVAFLVAGVILVGTATAVGTVLLAGTRRRC